MSFLNSGTGGSGAGLSSFLSGLFGNSGAPYDEAMQQYAKFQGNTERAQNPFINAGHSAIPMLQDWLKNMKDPSAFINNLMGGYSQSPQAKYLTQQANNAGVNAASAGGLIGSTPYLQQAQQNAGNIASQDMNSWLQNVLGINSEYGKGQQNLINTGSHAADSMTQFYNNLAQMMGDAAYGKEAGKQNDWSNMIGGGIKMLTNGIFG